MPTDEEIEEEMEKGRFVCAVLNLTGVDIPEEFLNRVREILPSMMVLDVRIDVPAREGYTSLLDLVHVVLSFVDELAGSYNLRVFVFAQDAVPAFVATVCYEYVESGKEIPIVPEVTWKGGVPTFVSAVYLPDPEDFGDSDGEI